MKLVSVAAVPSQDVLMYILDDGRGVVFILSFAKMYCPGDNEGVDAERHSKACSSLLEAYELSTTDEVKALAECEDFKVIYRPVTLQ